MLVYRLINNITSYIVKNGFVLLGPDGKPTTWGRWDPDLLNNDEDWYDQRGMKKTKQKKQNKERAKCSEKEKNSTTKNPIFRCSIYFFQVSIRCKFSVTLFQPTQ